MSDELDQMTKCYHLFMKRSKKKKKKNFFSLINKVQIKKSYENVVIDHFKNVSQIEKMNFNMIC